MKTTLTFASLALIMSQSAIAMDSWDLRELQPQAPQTDEAADSALKLYVPEVIIPLPLEEPDVKFFQAGRHYMKRVLTSTKPQTTGSETFVTVPGAITKVKVPAGKNALVNVAYTAESRCNEYNSTSPNWCEVRILVNGVEASPQASTYQPDTYAFDSTDQGTETASSWESHAMDRHACVYNADGKEDKVVPIEVQWKVTNFDGNNPPAFWLDDWSFTIEMARGCREKTIDFD